MTPERFQSLTRNYGRLRVAVVGDFCLDRYLEIDPARNEISIETGRTVHNVVNVRAQPGGAGTVLNNLVALGIETILPVGFAGEDGEGFELRRALSALRGVRLDYFLQTSDRHTFTYCKPLVIEPGKAPVELNRLDQKNWSPTPPDLSDRLRKAVRSAGEVVDAVVLLGQVDVPETGVLTKSVLEAVGDLVRERPGRLMLADNRFGLRGFPPVIYKMNAAELATLKGTAPTSAIGEIGATAGALAKETGQTVVVTLSERGLIGAAPEGSFEHIPALPVRGEIDIVGAGDAVSASLLAALASGAKLREALELANAAASVAIHQLGTTGTASVGQLRETLFGRFPPRLQHERKTTFQTPVP